MGTENKTLFLGIPIHETVDPLFFQCTLEFVQACKTPTSYCILAGDSLVPRARNTLTRAFLESGCSDLIMIDSDILYSAEQVVKLLARDEDVIGGFYLKKKHGEPEYVCNTLDGEALLSNPDGTVELKYIGTGFLKVSRAAILRMIAAYPETSYTRDESKTTEYDLWHAGVYEYPDGTRRYLSEDWWFCQKWRDLGGKVYGDATILLKHSAGGATIFPTPEQEKIIFERAELRHTLEQPGSPEPNVPIREGLPALISA